MAASNSSVTTTTTIDGSTSAAAAAKYQYVNSLSDIQTVKDLSQDGVRDILRNFTSDHSLTVSEMGKLEDMSGLNDAFNSCICSMKVKVMSNEEEKEFNFVIKSPPKMSFVRQVHKLTQPFYNEVMWYMELIKQLELANENIDHILPKCYHAYSTYYNNDDFPFNNSKCPWFCYLPCKPSDEGILILENIKLRPGRSYHMYDKRKPLPLDHVKLVLTEIAHFHGKWLKWKYMSKRNLLGSTGMSWKTFESTFNTQKRIPQILYKQLANVAKKTTIKILKKKGGEEENIRKCRTFFERTTVEWLANYMNKPDSPIHTLCHGDLWSNNILFTYDDENQVRDLNIIDYQLLSYGHPCYDLVYFLYLNTDLSFRDSHLREILKTYYDVFNSYLSKHCDEEDGFSYSFDDFVADFNWHRSVGFTTACSVMPNVLSDSQMDLEATGFMALRELQRKQARELSDDSNPSTLEIRRRIVDMVHEMARDGVI